MIPAKIREQLPIYADGELHAEARAEIERHLAQSAELRAELERWKALRQCCRRVVADEATPVGLQGRVAAQVAGAPRPLPVSRTIRLFASVTALAAALVAGVFVWNRINSTRPANPGGGSVQVAGLDVTASQFATIYRHCAVNNHDDKFHKRGADPATARVELAAAQGYRLLMPDLSSEGFVLDGVCPCFPEKGVKAIHAFYRKNGEKPQMVSFFSLARCVTLTHCKPDMCCEKMPTKRRYDLAIDNEVTLVKWDEGANSYAVVGQMSSEDLMRLASSVDVAALESLGPAIAAAQKSGE